MSKTTLDTKKWIPLPIHILFCVAILIIPLLVMSHYSLGNYKYYTGYIIRTCVLIFIFYINYLFLIEKFLFRKQFIVYIIINLALITGIMLLQNLMFELLIGLPPKLRKGSDIPHHPYQLRIIGDYVLFVFVIGTSVAFKMTRRWYRYSINLEAIKASQLEADLKNLRSQLNPHFLFNTLNNIYSLIAIDTNKAQESIHRLSSLLRYILYENEQRFVPIDKEIEFTQNYIDLMRLRVCPDMKLNLVIKYDNYRGEIASLLFITLIENAFKHGMHNGEDSFIDINIYVDDEKGVLCTVENSLGETTDNIESKNSGIGLVNLRKRLKLLYPDKHELRIEKREKSFYVLLGINFK